MVCLGLYFFLFKSILASCDLVNYILQNSSKIHLDMCQHVHCTMYMRIRSTGQSFFLQQCFKKMKKFPLQVYVTCKQACRGAGTEWQVVVCVCLVCWYGGYSYSRVRNKHSPTLINFLTFFQGLRPYSGLNRGYLSIV